MMMEFAAVSAQEISGSKCSEYNGFQRNRLQHQAGDEDQDPETLEIEDKLKSNLGLAGLFLFHEGVCGAGCSETDFPPSREFPRSDK